MTDAERILSEKFLFVIFDDWGNRFWHVIRSQWIAQPIQLLIRDNAHNRAAAGVDLSARSELLLARQQVTLHINNFHQASPFACYALLKFNNFCPVRNRSMF